LAAAPSERDRLILVGRVAGAFGVKGEVRLTAYTADPMALAGYRALLREDGSPGLTVLGARPVKDAIICRVAELDSKEAADALRGLRLFVSRAALPPPDEEEYYLADLIGLAVRSPEGESLGRIKAVHDFGAGDILEIEPGGGRASWMQPFTREAVPEVKIADGYVVAVRLPEIMGDAPDGQAPE
jgi:16S rRNA processing protein RimM